MTNNQVNYAKHREDVRHNVVSEIETNRSNVARETETNRHNVVTTNEMERHNRETEQIGWSTHYENVRRNQAQEEINWANVSVGHRQASAAQMSANAAWANSETNRSVSGSTSDLNFARAAEARSKAGYTDTEVKYLDDKNWQNWTKTVTGGISDLSALSKFINPLSGLSFGK